MVAHEAGDSDYGAASVAHALADVWQERLLADYVLKQQDVLTADFARVSATDAELQTPLPSGRPRRKSLSHHPHYLHRATRESPEVFRDEVCSSRALAAGCDDHVNVTVPVCASDIATQRVHCRHRLAVVSTVRAPNFAELRRSRRESEADRLERRLYELVTVAQIRLLALTQKTTLCVHN